MTILKTGEELRESLTDPYSDTIITVEGIKYYVNIYIAEDEVICSPKFIHDLLVKLPANLEERDD